MFLKILKVFAFAVFLSSCSDEPSDSMRTSSGFSDGMGASSGGSFVCVSSTELSWRGEPTGYELECDSSTEYCGREIFRGGVYGLSSIYGCRDLKSCSDCDCLISEVQAETSDVANCDGGIVCSEDNGAFTVECSTPDLF